MCIVELWWEQALLLSLKSLSLSLSLSLYFKSNFKMIFKPGRLCALWSLGGGELYLWGMKLSHKLRAGILFKLLLHRNQHCAMNDTISQDFFPRQGQVSGSGSVSQPTFFVIFYPKSTKIALSNGPFWPPIWALIGN